MTIAAAVVLVIVGLAVGTRVGGAIGGLLRRSPLGPLDRLLGAAGQVVIVAAAVSLLASITIALHTPYAAQAAAGSTVLRSIHAVTPAPVAHSLQQLRDLLPPPPIASFQQSQNTPSSAAESQTSQESLSQTPKKGRIDKTAVRPGKAADDDSPWGPEVQKKYDEFLHDERIYVTEGLWDRFPIGSRLFVG